MAKKKSGNKKKRTSTQPRQTNLEENTDAIVEDTKVNEAEVPKDLPSTDKDNISDSLLINNSNEEDNIIRDSDFSANDVKDVISADDQQEIPHVGGESEKTEPEDFETNEIKPSDISEIDSDVDSSDFKQSEDPSDSVGMDQFESGVDISDAKTEVVDNTDIVEESDLIQSDDVDHPDDEDFGSHIQNTDVLNEEKDVISAIEDIEDHPDDESPIIIQAADDTTSEEVASKLETEMDDVESAEKENNNAVEEQRNVEEHRIEEEQLIAEKQRMAEEQRIAEDLKRKVEEETRLAEEVLKEAEEQNLLAEKARMEKERSLKAQEESRLAEDASISKEKAPQDSSRGENVTLYSLSELMVPKEGVDWAKREIYLKDDEFLLHFEMDKIAFNKLPKWKQVAAKKKVGIF